MLKTQLIPDQKHFWELSFGKLPADQLFDLSKDSDCTTNLAARVPFAALQKQLFEELKQQADPRIAGNGRIFDDYPYATPPGLRGLYEKVMARKQLKANGISDSDIQPGREPAK